MKAFSFVGRSGSGKTRLIAGLVGELKKRGRKVAVIKHCPHGFSLDRAGKDSSRVFDAGARSVGLISPRKTAVIQRSGRAPDYLAFAEKHFQDVDILLIEGGHAGKGIQKIEVLGKEEPCRPVRKADERIAVVSDYGRPGGPPVFRHSQVIEIAKFLESRPGR
jgi:molybdopterin-guanine dinucleotide biosynthesis protein B